MDLKISSLGPVLILSLLLTRCGASDAPVPTNNPGLTVIPNIEINFLANGGSGQMPAMSVPQSSNILLQKNIFTFPGYEFAGWSIEPYGNVIYGDEDPYAVGDKNQYLYAQWNQIPQNSSSVLINFNANGGQGSMGSLLAAKESSVYLLLNSFSRTGSQFMGWSVNVDSSTIDYTNGASYSVGTEDVTLYAVWTEEFWGQYNEQRVLEASNGEGNDLFGYSDVFLSASIKSAFLPEYNLEFRGNSIGLSGDAILIGAAGESSKYRNDLDNNEETNSGAAYLFQKNDVLVEQYIKAPNIAGDWRHTDGLYDISFPGDSFGFSAAISGDTIVVGSPFESSTDGEGASIVSDAMKGAAYVYTNNLGVWTHQATLKVEAASTNLADLFGVSVSIDGDTIVVGAIGEDSADPNDKGDNGFSGCAMDGILCTHNSGAAYVFSRDMGTWSLAAYIKSQDPTQRQDYFGHRVLVDGDTIVVSAPYEDSGFSVISNIERTPLSINDSEEVDSGIAYVYTKDTDDTWNLQSLIKAMYVDTGDYFGYSLDLSGDTIVIGVPFEDSNSTGVYNSSRFHEYSHNNDTNDSGAAFVFSRDLNNNWQRSAYLFGSTANADDQFGHSVSIKGDTIVVGAPNDDLGISDSDHGSAYVFIRSNGEWLELQKLQAATPVAGGHFGFNVANDVDTSGSSILISAAKSSTGADKQGAVYLYELGQSSN